MRRARLPLAVLAALAALSCSNAGENRILAVGATGVVRGFIYFDVNGNRLLDNAPVTGDDSVGNVRIRLLSKSSGDTIASALSDVRGFYHMADVPVGSYRIVLDSAPLIDTAIVAQRDSTEITVPPLDSVQVNFGISYPHVTVAQARALVPGRRVFVVGIVLNGPGNFRDTTMHAQDVSAGIRAARVLATAAGPGDSVRLRGTTARRQVSASVTQPILDNVTTFILAPRFLPAAVTLSTAQAASAAAGTRDAQYVQVLNATITDTASTLPTGGDFRLTVNDAALTGPLEVLLDGVADPVFRTPIAGTTPYKPGNRFNIVGILVPTGTPGVWRLKPRNSGELIQQ